MTIDLKTVVNLTRSHFVNGAITKMLTICNMRVKLDIYNYHRLYILRTKARHVLLFDT